MSNINPTYFDRVRYTLYNKNQGALIITEPIGWNSDEKELTRHEQYHGIISRFSNSLKFIGSGKDFIQMVYDIDGINAEIKLKREEKHPQTDIWTLSYSGYLDLSTWNTENNQLAVKFNSGGLEQLLKARESEQVEIDRLTTVDGRSIIGIDPITIELEGRRIFLKTKYGIEPTANNTSMSSRSTGHTDGDTIGVPIKIINKSHEEAQNVLEQAQSEWGNGNESGTVSNMFFLICKRDRTLRISFTLKFTVNNVYTNELNWADFSVLFTKYKDGADLNFKEDIVLKYESKADSMTGKTFSIPFDQTVQLLEGESLSLRFGQRMDANNGHIGDLSIYCTEIECNLSIDEDSFYEKSTTKAVLAHELISKLVTIATNKDNAFYSDFLGRTDLGYSVDGKGSGTGVTHGFWVRQFDKLPIPSENPKVDNLFKPLTTSFKDAVKSLDAVWNVGIGIETTGFRERVRLEELSYFYNNNVTIRLPFQVKNVKRSVATEYYYSGLEFGSEKGGDYEEACGLDEYNTKSTFTTVINRIKETYSKISKYRSDSYGMEFARRKPKSLNDTEDTKYDSDIFLLDLIKGSSYRQRKWQDDFDKQPTGVFSPETATNLRFSPFNCLLRHSWWFGGCFKKYLIEYVRYGSSVSNSQLKTKLIGKNEYAENGSIINTELNRARFFPEKIEFEHVCDFNTMQMVEGITIILGKEIKNFYGLVEFINEKNENEKGFLTNLKPNGKGQWTILKSNR